ncbi:MAG: DUF2199 domain-containing protein [Pseudomonadota bacterium]
MRLEDDIRWQRLHEVFGGVFDIGFDHPDAWPHGSRRASGLDVLKEGEDKLGTDLCQLGPLRYIRCALPLPILGSEAVFGYGVWAEVAPDDFTAYLTAWDAEDYSEFSGAAAALANALPGWNIATPVAAKMRVTSPEVRPALWVDPAAHPIGAAQQRGISFDVLLDIYAEAGSDLRPQLEQP